MRSFEYVDRLMREGIETKAFPGAAAAVGVNGKTLFRKCYGVTRLEGGVSVNDRTKFDMASVTKLLSTASSAWRTIEKGRLALDDTLDRYFATLSDKKDITVRQLMTHTSGLSPSLPIWRECQSPALAEAYILSKPLAYETGTQVQYSCMGFILLGKILEKIWGRPLNEIAREQVFAPLGMTDTGYLPAASENIAATELDAATGLPWQGVVHDENARFLGGVSGNAGVFSTILDVERYAQVMACGGGELICKALYDRARKNYTPGMGSHRGLGLHLVGVPESYGGDVFPEDSFGHTGFTGTSVLISPSDGVYAVLLTNRVHPSRENSKLDRFRRVFHNASYAAAMGD